MTPKTYATEAGRRAAIRRAKERVLDQAENLYEQDPRYGDDDLRRALSCLQRAIDDLRATMNATIQEHE